VLLAATPTHMRRRPGGRGHHPRRSAGAGTLRGDQMPAVPLTRIARRRRGTSSRQSRPQHRRRSSSHHRLYGPLYGRLSGSRGRCRAWSHRRRRTRHSRPPGTRIDLLPQPLKLSRHNRLVPRARLPEQLDIRRRVRRRLRTEHPSRHRRRTPPTHTRIPDTSSGQSRQTKHRDHIRTNRRHPRRRRGTHRRPQKQTGIGGELNQVHTISGQALQRGHVPALPEPFNVGRIQTRGPAAGECSQLAPVDCLVDRPFADAESGGGSFYGEFAHGRSVETPNARSFRLVNRNGG
jgi:hypothetical protein